MWLPERLITYTALALEAGVSREDVGNPSISRGFIHTAHKLTTLQHAILEECGMYASYASHSGGRWFYRLNCYDNAKRTLGELTLEQLLNTRLGLRFNVFNTLNAFFKGHLT